MSRHLYFVTPCGHTSAEAQTTIDSVISLARQRPDISVVHLVIFNNGLAPQADSAAAPPNYQIRISDLGDLPSRAASRNHGIDALADEPVGVVCFLDAGDVALDSAAVDIAFGELTSEQDQRLWAFSARIVGDDIYSIRRPRGLWLRKINNPFLIGATYTSTPLTASARFPEGAKEDWKYWLELLEAADSVSLHQEVAYEYQVVSTTDHIRRKRGLFREQYRFFSDHLGYGHGVRTTLSMFAHTLIAGTAWLRRSATLQPWRKAASN